MSQKTRWDTNHEGAYHYVDLLSDSVVVGHHYGSGHTDYGGEVSFAEFLAGRYQDLVLRAHGEAALAEVVAAVQARAAGR